ncbi:zinc finger protein [Saccharopolyspora sp. ID03-671]|uniref:zinc finger protein n=1 Tax=Saccharopolyspora sp. ID03-671 TaxID=3073066 RepID=UPI0032457151
MHPFRWVPADGGRHATADIRLAGAYAVGESITALCRRSVTVARGTELAWLWPTCAECNREAHALVETGVSQ